MAQVSRGATRLASLLLCLLSPASAAFWPAGGAPRLPERRVSDPLPSITKIAQPARHFQNYGAKRYIFKYKSHMAPASNDPEYHGMREFEDLLAEAPCSNCYITAMHAGLEFKNGSVANTDTGLWLHHILMTDLDASRKDVACPTYDKGYRFFASGNERTPIELTLNGTSKTGIKLLQSPIIGYGLQLMNERPAEQEVVFTMDIEYIPTLSPDFRPIDPVWLDVTGACGESDVKVTSHVMNLTTSETQLGFSGKIITAGGHLHDGGTLCRIKKNGSPLCDFVPRYGRPTSSQRDVPAPKVESSEAHISAMPMCFDVGRYEKGDKLSIEAYYNMSMHAPMMNANGTYEPVMGISIVYIERD